MAFKLGSETVVVRLFVRKQLDQRPHSSSTKWWMLPIKMAISSSQQWCISPFCRC